MLDPGLPHGRRWVADSGCGCDACRARVAEGEAAEAAARRLEVAESTRADRVARGLPAVARPVSTKVTYRMGRRGWVVCGPADQVRLGTVHARNLTTGRVDEVYVHRLGRTFTHDGVEQRYGYIRR